MPHDLQELKYLLDNSPVETRINLAKIIDPPHSDLSKPDNLCDHVNFLSQGGLAQFFPPYPSYKQIVTNVADQINIVCPGAIDWEKLVHETSWKQLAAYHIETEIVSFIDQNIDFSVDTEHQISPEVSDTITNTLIVLISTLNPEIAPFAAAGKPMLGSWVKNITSLQAVRWTKLLATVVYVRKVIRPHFS